MYTLKRLAGGSLMLFVLAGAALAQESRAPIDAARERVSPAAAAPLVTATATAKRVRFVSPGTVVQLRLEVFDEAGQKLFDTEQRGGNVLDWNLQDGAGERLPSGSYATVLTIKSLSGRISQRVGVVSVNGEKAAVEAAATDKLSLAQQQVIGPMEGSAAFTILHPSEAEALTTATHDGTKGQISRTHGPLSFRVGDIFSGKDKEQMRLTEDGRLGVGTSDPQAKLDVAGTIRAERVVIAKPGKPGSSDNADNAQAPDSEQPLATGSGTVNRVAKWTETGGAGTLGDTQITESNGSVVVGNSGQTGNIQIYGTAVQDVFAGMGQDINAGPAFNYGYAGLSFGRSAGFFNVRPDASATPPNPSLRFMTANVQRMIITNTGNVGIGTSNPNAASKLDVVGHINTSTEYNIRGIRMLSTSGTSDSNTFVGRNSGVLSNAGFSNTFMGMDSGANNAGAQNSFFGRGTGYQNTSGYNNTFIGFDAGVTNSTGFRNTAIGAFAHVGTNLTNAQAIGYRAMPTTHNSLVLGSIINVNDAPGSANVGIGTTAPRAKLHIRSGSVAGPGTLSSSGTTVTGSGGSEFTLKLHVGDAITSDGQTRTVDSITDDDTLTVSAAFSPVLSADTYTFQEPYLQLTDGADATKFMVSQIGNVGVNTNNPLAPLHVNGTSILGAVFTGDLTVNGTLTANIPGGDSSYIQSNPASQQSGASFNIAGSGTAAGTLSGNIVNATTRFDINNSRVFSIGGTNNTFAGVNAANANPSGTNNSFFGKSAGAATAGGGFNSFFGSSAGAGNLTGTDNSFFGASAGAASTGTANSFFGSFAGDETLAGGSNSFFGTEAGDNNAGGNYNTFVGRGAGAANTSGSENTIVGTFANLGSAGLSNATAIGANAVVSASNSLVLGNNAKVGIGTSTPNAKLQVVGGDAAITTQGNGLILRATDGIKCFRLTVNNTGTLSTTEVTCPL